MVIGKTSGVNYKLRTRDGNNYVSHVGKMERFYTKKKLPTQQKEAGKDEAPAPSASNKLANTTKTKKNNVPPVPPKKDKPKKGQLRRQVTLPRRFKDFVVDMRRNYLH
jgi:hypothetical protein